MTCRYCNTENPADWTRCRKCDAPLNAALVESPRSRRRAASAALAAAEDLREPAGWAKPAAEAAAPRPVYQPDLFGGAAAPKIVPIRPGAEPRPRHSRGATHRAAVSGGPAVEQRKLSFPEPATGRKRAGEGVVACNAPVAGITHRVLAFVIDLSMVAIASGFAVLGFAFWGGAHLTGRQAAMLCTAAFVFFWTLYQLLWCAANLDSAGMAWVRLRCLDFNGCRPRPRQRLIRLAVFCLGSLAGGLGLSWALVDEEALTWQDHVSGTFPTPY